MRGRYGSDELNNLLLVLGVVFTILGHFFKIFSSLSLVCIFYALFRMFSKNIYQRRQENARVAPYWAYIRAKFKNKGQFKLFLCPKCKRTLRVPKGKGNITLSCPCGNSLKRKS